LSDPQDDADIIAIGRALNERGGVLQFGEAELVDDGFKVTATMSATVTVKLREEIAHGRSMALQMLQPSATRRMILCP
jgi:hypothetical protein